MSEPSSSYTTFESEEESSGWLMSSETSLDDDDDDELSDELTLLNGDENNDGDSSDDNFIELSQRLKEKYNLEEATVKLERCDKIWDTMQLLKNVQPEYESDDTLVDDDDNDDDDNDDDDDEQASSRSNSCAPETANSSVPYIKYQPVQGNGNNALPNFYLAVKSQRKVYHCVTCGKQYIEKRGLRVHSEKEHGIILPSDRNKHRIIGEPRNLRPKTPSDLASRIGRDSSTDDKVGQNSSSRERENSKSRLTNSNVDAKDTIENGRLKSTGSKELDQLLGDSYVQCPICASTYLNRKSLATHTRRFHGMSLVAAEKYTPTKPEQPPVVVEPKKEISRTRDESSSSKGTRERHKNVRAAASIAQWLSGASNSPEVKRETTSRRRDKSHHKIVQESRKNYQSLTIDGVKFRYMYTCKSCSKTFFERKCLRTHTSRHHGLSIPFFKRGGWLEASKNSEIFKADLVRVDDRTFVMTTPNTLTKSKRFSESNSKIREKRTGIDRPRRACASRTSYTECTKEEEEVLQKSLSSIPVSPASSTAKTPPSQMTNCFLCKKSFVDIRKHLVDYHRINSPESILPLTAKNETESKEEPVAASTRIVDDTPIPTVTTTMETETEKKTEKTEKPEKPETKQKSSTNVECKDPNVAVVYDTKGRKRFQCVICLYKYTGFRNVMIHLNRFTVKGVVQQHEAFSGWQARDQAPTSSSSSSSSVTNDPIADPLALTDASDASKTNSVCSGDDDFHAVKRKRITRMSNERFTPSPEPEKKRRKSDDSEVDGDAQNGIESVSDIVRNNVEQESVIELSETDRSSVEEVKSSPNHRDTRDSSDRDSGIGISITIKKRNDSYEVVEKDIGGDDDKSSKDFDNTKDDTLLLCSDSSSDVTPVDYVSYDQETRRREILNSIDCSKDENVLGTMRKVNGVDVESEKKTDDRCTNDETDNNFHWKEACCGVEACNNMPGKVPSLKVLCRSALTNEEFAITMSNNVSLSHQCPVCCRFYPTERDVTVHMLEHKVSRTNFRTTRLHIIPSSALRRYGRRPV